MYVAHTTQNDRKWRYKKIVHHKSQQKNKNLVYFPWNYEIKAKRDVSDGKKDKNNIGSHWGDDCLMRIAKIAKHFQRNHHICNYEQTWMDRAHQKHFFLPFSCVFMFTLWGLPASRFQTLLQYFSFLLLIECVTCYFKLFHSFCYSHHFWPTFLARKSFERLLLEFCFVFALIHSTRSDFFSNFAMKIHI